MAFDRKLGVFWLVVAGVLLTWVWPGWFVVITAVLMGAVTAAIRIQLFARAKLKMAEYVVLIEGAILWGFLFLLPDDLSLKSGWAYLCVAALAVGVTNIGTVLFERHINRRIEATIFGTGGLFPEPARVEPEVAWRELPAMAPDPVWASYRESAAPAVTLAVGESIREAGIGSRLGGVPDLPEAFDWPTFQGGRLDFLAQIRLDEVAAANPSLGLPKAGLLSFFYSPEQPWGNEEADRGSARVYLHALDSVRAAKAETKTVPVTFRRIESLNYSEDVRTITWGLEAGVPREDRGSYNQLLEAITPHEDAHQLMGHPVLIQGDMDDALAKAAGQFALAAGTRWTLLLQLWSEPRLEWCWGDAGALYFWIPAEDLARSRFDRIWVVLQCT